MFTVIEPTAAHLSKLGIAVPNGATSVYVNNKAISFCVVKSEKIDGKEVRTGSDFVSTQLKPGQFDVLLEAGLVGSLGHALADVGKLGFAR